MLGGVQRTLFWRLTLPHSWQRPAHASPPAVVVGRERQYDIGNETSCLVANVILALSSGRPTKSLSDFWRRDLQQALDARWKTGVRDRQERGSGVVGDVEGGRASYRERFD